MKTIREALAEEDPFDRAVILVNLAREVPTDVDGETQRSIFASILNRPTEGQLAFAKL